LSGDCGLRHVDGHVGGERPRGRGSVDDERCRSARHVLELELHRLDHPLLQLREDDGQRSHRVDVLEGGRIDRDVAHYRPVRVAEVELDGRDAVLLGDGDRFDDDRAGMFVRDQSDAGSKL
jgi:hypothetical protein